jgi:hypothetical protein
MRPERRKAHAGLVVATREAPRHPDDPSTLAALVDRQREYKQVALEDYVRDAVASWPPLTDEQKSKIAVLLRGTRTPDNRGAA